MLTIINNKTEPAFNLALEEYLLKEYVFDEDILLIWRNDLSVILGRNQNPWNEVNLRFTDEQNIPVFRRISGGGTVVHDLGNINFSFISNNSKNINNYEYFLTPIINILNSVGVEARFEPKSHVYVKDLKISGNAQALHKGKMIHHGTLLFDSTLDQFYKCLKKTPIIEGHFVDSNRTDVCNIKSLLAVQTTTDEFMNFLRDELLLNDTINKTISLTEKDIKKIEKIKESRYKQFDWNFGKSFKFSNEEFYLNVKNGIINESSIANLVGLKLLPNVLEDKLESRLFNLIF